jgi:hypothetical protein
MRLIDGAGEVRSVDHTGGNNDKNDKGNPAQPDKTLSHVAPPIKSQKIPHLISFSGEYRDADNVEKGLYMVC